MSLLGLGVFFDLNDRTSLNRPNKEINSHGVLWTLQQDLKKAASVPANQRITVKGCLNQRPLFSSVHFSHLVMSNPLRPHKLQHARPPCPSPTLRVHPNSWHQVGDAIHPSHPPLPPSPPVPNPSQQQSLFKWVNSSHEVAKVLEFQL